ncbi:MAG: CocE/NonD family hydrolase [Chloroflexi bacterium]|nr:CocE/NonD family hydrolase [Chloroflexota bacterium]
MPKSTLVDENVRVPMRDAAHIVMDVHRPASPGRHPAILMRSYGRRFGNRNPLLIRDLVDAGYAYVNSEVRGRGGSDGEWHPERAASVEGVDGYDTIEWLAAQPWCDGNVGMIGASHMAAMQYFAAFEHPPHLRAIAPWTGGGPGSGGSGFRPARSGGVMSLITTLVWMPNEGPGVLDNLERQGNDVSQARALLARVRRDPTELYEHLPLLDHPLGGAGRLGELFRWRVQTPNLVDERAPRDWSRIELPCLHECGWYDAVNWAEFENFGGLRSAAGTPEARAGQHIVCGPWQHGMQFQSTLGDLHFGENATNEGSGLHALQIAFFDRYVRGNPNIRLPRVRYFVMGANEWREADDWPPPAAARHKLYLHSGGNANSAAGGGALGWTPPEAELSDAFVYDPHRPVPTVGGAMIGAVTGPGVLVGPIEQARVERRHDVLCYTSEPMSADVEISGPLEVHLWVSTSAVDTDFTAKLTQVYPDGQSYNLAEGILRLSGRHLDGQQAAVAPGEVYAIVITLGHTSLLLRAGFRLRLQVSSSSFPQYDRNMNTGHPIGTDASGIRALQTVYHDTQHPSFIAIPVVGDQSDT